MNYSIIQDEKILKDFIQWLPELTNEEVYYLCLFARSKYTRDEEGKNGIPHISTDKAQLKRFTATKDRIYNKIQQLECPIGAYMQRDIVIPQEALALYITVNPRNLWKATKNSLKHFAEVVVTEGKTMNPQADAMSEIQKAKSRTCYIIADLDSKDPESLEAAVGQLNPLAYQVIETRGGYHILVDPDKIKSTLKKTWYQNLKSHTDVDQMGDLMIPVPGTYQGGFIPHFVNNP